MCCGPFSLPSAYLLHRKRAQPGPRTITIKPLPGAIKNERGVVDICTCPGALASTKPISLLGVNQEARMETLHRYKLYFGVFLLNKAIYMDLSVDNLYFVSQDAWTCFFKSSNRPGKYEDWSPAVQDESVRLMNGLQRLSIGGGPLSYTAIDCMHTIPALRTIVFADNAFGQYFLREEKKHFASAMKHMEDRHKMRVKTWPKTPWVMPKSMLSGSIFLLYLPYSSRHQGPRLDPCRVFSNTQSLICHVLQSSSCLATILMILRMPPRYVLNLFTFCKYLL